jgi:hypothetical protein
VLYQNIPVFAAVSFSKVTVALCVESEGEISRLVIFPLFVCQIETTDCISTQEAYQKEKKSRTSFSLVEELIFLT